MPSRSRRLVMRTLLKASMQVEAANRAIRDGTIGGLIDSLIQQLKPEACYFGPENGLRTMYIVFDLQDASQIPVIAEPLFEVLQAQVTMVPVMNEKDLKLGLSKLSKGAEKAHAPS